VFDFTRGRVDFPLIVSMSWAEFDKAVFGEKSRIYCELELLMLI
jgi:hypothetical protein